MNKRAIILSICLSIAISIIAPFQIFALRDMEQLTIPYYYEYYNEPIYAYSDTHLTGGSSTMNFNNFMSYYYNNIQQGSLNCIDNNFDVMFCISNTDTNSIFGLSVNTMCLPFADSQLGQPYNQVCNMLIDIINGAQISSGYSFYSIGQLENLDYRLYDKVIYQTIYGTTYYVYVLCKMKFPDEIQYSGGLNGSYNFTWSTISGSYSREYYKITFDFSSATDSQGNYPFFEDDFKGYFTFMPPNLNNLNYFSLLNTQDCIYTNSGILSESKIGCNVTYVRMTPGIVANNKQSGTGTVTVTYVPYIDSNTDLSSINNKLNSIIDLLQELNIENETINNIVNDYNIDIDLTISNLLNNLQLNINSIDLTDSKYQVTQNDISAFNDLKQIYISVIDTLDQVNISFLYIIPIVAIIVGALL